MPDLAAVVLAAGAGSRLSPLTSLRPKALCPVGDRTLLDHALHRVAPAVDPRETAVNLHHGADMVERHLDQTDSPVHRSLEEGFALGTAGALGELRQWLDGRHVLVANADLWAGEGLDVEGFVAGWDRERVRLMTVDTGRPADFGTLRYCGLALMPARHVQDLRPEPSGLYEVSWRAEWEAGRLDLVNTTAVTIDCGTPADYLRANLVWSGGASVVDPGARVASGAILDRSVVWDDSEVHRSETLTCAIRAGRLTVMVR
jgi:NDP-sugar pyrophosphorylase family protein